MCISRGRYFGYYTYMTRAADLAAYVFDGRPQLLTPSLQAWMEENPRFADFIDTYRDKVRKKVRTAKSAQSQLDLRGELEVAYCLLKDRRLEVAYEPYASTGARGPDYAVTYRANRTFNIEVARIRAVEETASAGRPERIQRILFEKLGQMKTGMPNLLLIHASDALAQTIPLEALMHDLKLRVEKRELAGRYAGPADFYRDFARLNAILLWCGSPQLWVNKQARIALDERVLHLVASLR